MTIVEIILLSTNILILGLSGLLAYRNKLAKEKLNDYEIELIQKDSLINHVASGYYIWNAVDGDETISSDLKHAFHISIEEDKDIFDQIINCLCTESQHKLETIFEALQEQTSDSKINLQTNIDDKRQFFQCFASSFSDENDSIAEIILWFVEHTEERTKYHKLFVENRKLQSENKHLTHVLNAAPFPIWQRLPDLSIRYCNRTYSQYVEYGPEKEYGSQIPEMGKHAFEFAERAKIENKPCTEERHLVIDGKRRLFSITETPIAEDGTFAGFAKDITEQEELEKELTRNISLQSDLMESSGSAMAIYGLDTKLKLYNNAFVSLWGLDEQWLHNRPGYADILEYLREKRKLPEQVNFQEFKNEQMRYFTDLIEPYNDFLYLPDGRTLRVIIIPHASGGLLFAYEDMTDWLTLERSYKTLSEVQNVTLEHLHEGVTVFGQDGRLKLCNTAFQKMWDLSKNDIENEPHISELMEKTKHFHIVDDNWEDYLKETISYITNSQSTHMRLERADKSVLDRIVVPLPDGGTMVTYIDVTDSTLLERSLRERNEALEEADRLKTEFLANVSYELRSPLTSIMGFSEVLKEALFGELNSNQQEYAEGIYASSRQLMMLINDILDLASIEAGLMALNVESIDIYGLFNSIIPLIQERIKKHHLTLTVKCPEDIGTIDGDTLRIKQVVFKLLSNAIKFTEPGGEITLGAAIQDDAHILLWVEDTGVGIPQEELEAVSGKFYKSVFAKAQNKSGAGLGLSVVRSFIDLHNGKLQLDSSPGVGTKVSCILKRSNPDLYTLSSSKITQRDDIQNSENFHFA